MRVENYAADAMPALRAFLDRYRAVFPDAKLAPPELYTYHPAAEDGQNVFCALDEGGAMVGFAPLFPAPVDAAAPPELPHYLWTIVVADPALAEADADAIRVALFAPVLARAEALLARFSAPRRVFLGGDYMASQHPDIAYLRGQGFEPYQRILVMQRELAAPLLELLRPEGITVRRWRMETEDEQRAYLAALNRCFPGHPKDLASLRCFIQSPVWSTGTAVAAFDAAGDLVGSVLCYASGAGAASGITDDVFVLPPWRGRGLARYLINEGLRFFQERGFERAVLEVRSDNDPAVRVYQVTGHTVVHEQVLLRRCLREA